MLQARVQTPFIEKNPNKILDNIKSAIRKSKSANMTVDISMLNLIDASKVATMASTYHFLKFSDGKINWIVNSKEIEKMLKPMNLGNTKFIYE
ncbi:hypothetical protein IKE67_05685 [bacterium]|nr:hypothetical protein [bacterium]